MMRTATIPRRRSSLRELTVAGVMLAVCAGAGAGAHAAPKAAPAIVVKRAVAGGWFLEPAPGNEGMQARPFAVDAARTRFALPVVVRDAKMTRVLRSAVVIGDANGNVLRVVDLERRIPLETRLALDGSAVAVLAQALSGDDDGGPEGVLVVASVAGKEPPAKRRVDLDSRVIAGKDTFAIAGAPIWAPQDSAEPQADAGPPGAVLREGAAPVAGETEPITFVRKNGDRTPAKVPLAGEIASLPDGGFVALGRKKLTRVDASLAKVWEVDAGFDGTVTASADGSRIAIADHSLTTKRRRVVLFDGAGRKLSETAVDAPAGVEVALSPDGTAMLVASVPARAETGSRHDPAESATLFAFDASSESRWAHPRRKDTPTRTWELLSMANGGALSAAGWIAEENGTAPSLVLFDATGRIVYQAEGFFDAYALDPSGSVLWTQEGSLLSRLSIAALKAGTAADPPPKR